MNLLPFATTSGICTHPHAISQLALLCTALAKQTSITCHSLPNNIHHWCLTNTNLTVLMKTPVPISTQNTIPYSASPNLSHTCWLMTFHWHTWTAHLINFGHSAMLPMVTPYLMQQFPNLKSEVPDLCSTSMVSYFTTTLPICVHWLQPFQMIILLTTSTNQQLPWPPPTQLLTLWGNMTSNHPSLPVAAIVYVSDGAFPIITWVHPFNWTTSAQNIITPIIFICVFLLYQVWVITLQLHGCLPFSCRVSRLRQHYKPIYFLGSI